MLVLVPINKKEAQILKPIHFVSHLDGTYILGRQHFLSFDVPQDKLKPLRNVTSISRKHIEISIKSGLMQLKALGSFFLNSKKVHAGTTVVLNQGDVIALLGAEDKFLFKYGFKIVNEVEYMQNTESGSLVFLENIDCNNNSYGNIGNNRIAAAATSSLTPSSSSSSSSTCKLLYPIGRLPTSSNSGASSSVTATAAPTTAFSSSSSSSSSSSTTTAAAEAVLEVINKLKRTYECSICYDLLACSQVLSCGHSFCYTCITDWAEQSKSCPNCQRAFDIDNTYPNIDLDKGVSDVLTLECEHRSSSSSSSASSSSSSAAKISELMHEWQQRVDIGSENKKKRQEELLEELKKREEEKAAAAALGHKHKRARSSATGGSGSGSAGATAFSSEMNMSSANYFYGLGSGTSAAAAVAAPPSSTNNHLARFFHHQQQQHHQQPQQPQRQRGAPPPLPPSAPQRRTMDTFVDLTSDSQSLL